MIHYLLQTIAFQLLFLMVYDLFLKNETFFSLNRMYLLGTVILSFILPLIQVEGIQQQIPSQYIIELPAILIGGVASETAVTAGSSAYVSPFRWEHLWYAGMLVATVLFTYKLIKLFRLKKTGTSKKVENFTLIRIPKTNTAFSFFNYIFLGEDLSEAHKNNILLHEKVHVTHKHTYDLLFFEALRIVCWFNPLLYLYQQRMVSLQEFTADAKVAALNGKKSYYQDLLSQVFQTEQISFVNTFFSQSLIKKRISMLRKTKSKKIFQLKYLVLLPLVSAMLVYTSCSLENKEREPDTVAQHIAELKQALENGENLSEAEKETLQNMLRSHASQDDLNFDAKNNGTGKSGAVPFVQLDKAPVFPGCEDVANEAENKKCFSQKVSEMIVNNFPNKELQAAGVSGRQRIIVEFTIDKTGYLGALTVRTNEPYLEAATREVFRKLPALTPGIHNGKDVAVAYKVPIIVEIDE